MTAESVTLETHLRPDPSSPCLNQAQVLSSVTTRSRVDVTAGAVRMSLVEQGQWYFQTAEMCLMLEGRSSPLSQGLSFEGLGSASEQVDKTFWPSDSHYLPEGTAPSSPGAHPQIRSL